MTHDPIQVSPATRRFNALVSTYDMLTWGQHDQATPSQIADWLRDTNQSTLYRQFRKAAEELGYRLADTPQSTRTETVKETQLFGI